MYPSIPLDSIERARIHELARSKAQVLRSQAIQIFWSDVSFFCVAAFQGLTRVLVGGLRQCTAHVARRFRTASGV